MPAAVPDLIDLHVEREVILRLHAGDRSAAAELVSWYSDKLFRQIIFPRLPVQEQAEDILRDTFRLAKRRSTARWAPRRRRPIGRRRSRRPA